MNGNSELRLLQPAHASSVAPIRHALRAFCEALGARANILDDITTAAGEALANVVEHAYGERPQSEGSVELHARVDESGLALEVADRGSFARRESLPWRGFGLRIMRTIADSMTIDTSDGTRVRMHFPAAFLES